MTRKRSAYRPRPVRAPVMPELRDTIAMGLYTAYGVLERGPDEQALEQLRDIFNMVGLAIEGDARFADEMTRVNAGALSIAHNGKWEHVGRAVTVIDLLLPRLDVGSLQRAMTKLRAM
jgi:hypothetical protein